jgi:hypothetical protein
VGVTGGYEHIGNVYNMSKSVARAAVCFPPSLQFKDNFIQVLRVSEAICCASKQEIRWPTLQEARACEARNFARLIAHFISTEIMLYLSL